MSIEITLKTVKQQKSCEMQHIAQIVHVCHTSPHFHTILQPNFTNEECTKYDELKR